MKVLFVDCPTGLAGDMLFAAFLDLGIPKKVFEKPLLQMGLGESFNLRIQESHSFGLRGLKVSFEGIEKDFSPKYLHEIIEMIDNFSWQKSLSNKVLSVFKFLAEAEASVHGKSIDKVHFHEIGSLDALIEVVGVCAAVEYLNPVEIVCSIPPAGSGSVKTSHGHLPVPVPVVMELAKRHQIKLAGGEDYPQGELTTPTGLALMAVLADQFGRPASFGIEAFGIGLGQRVLDRPNFLRVCSFEELQLSKSSYEQKGLNWQPLIFQEAWIDDATPEDLSTLITELHSAGAVEVVSQPVQMKKGRQGICVKAIVTSENANAVRLAWFSKGTTIGLREHLGGRWVLSRRRGSCSTIFGKIEAKQVKRPDGVLTIKPEHDELIRISNETGKSINEIRNKIFCSEENFDPKEDWSC